MNQAHKPSFSFELLYIIGIIAISFSSIFVRWSGNRGVRHRYVPFVPNQSDHAAFGLEIPH